MAITLCTNVAVYWTNRAPIRHRKGKEWGRVEEDCRKAIQLDHDSVKGCTSKELHGTRNMAGTFEIKIFKFYKSFLGIAEFEVCDGKVETCELALKEKFSRENSETEGFFDDMSHGHSENLEALGRVFHKAEEADIPMELPDYLCCKITFDIFRDPVITPGGLTYERAVLLEHLNKVVEFDPTTREPLTSSQLVPNLAIKSAVQAYLDEHGWAYKMF